MLSDECCWTDHGNTEAAEIKMEDLDLTTHPLPGGLVYPSAPAHHLFEPSRTTAAISRLIAFQQVPEVLVGKWEVGPRRTRH